MTMPAPFFDRLEVVQPDALQGTLEMLGYSGSLGAMRTFNEVLQRRAQEWMDRFVETGRRARPDPRILKVLVQQLPSQDDPALRKEIVHMALDRRHRVGWRHIWLLWEHAPELRQDIAPGLAELISAAVKRRPKLDATLPQWMGRDRSRLESALSAPVQFIIGWILKERVHLERVGEKLGCSPTSKVGREIMLELAARSPADWWSRLTLKQKFGWAERGGLDLVQAVADRELNTLGARAGGPGRVHLVKNRDALKLWIDRLMGDPKHHPGRWAPLSKRARDVRSWL